MRTWTRYIRVKHVKHRNTKVPAVHSSSSNDTKPTIVIKRNSRELKKDQAYEHRTDLFRQSRAKTHITVQHITRHACSAIGWPSKKQTCAQNDLLLNVLAHAIPTNDDVPWLIKSRKQSMNVKRIYTPMKESKMFTASIQANAKEKEKEQQAAAKGASKGSKKSTKRGGRAQKQRPAPAVAQKSKVDESIKVSTGDSETLWAHDILHAINVTVEKVSKPCRRAINGCIQMWIGLVLLGDVFLRAIPSDSPSKSAVDANQEEEAENKKSKVKNAKKDSSDEPSCNPDSLAAEAVQYRESLEADSGETVESGAKWFRVSKYKRLRVHIKELLNYVHKESARTDDPDFEDKGEEEDDLDEDQQHLHHLHKVYGGAKLIRDLKLFTEANPIDTEEEDHAEIVSLHTGFARLLAMVKKAEKDGEQQGLICMVTKDMKGAELLKLTTEEDDDDYDDLDAIFTEQAKEVTARVVQYAVEVSLAVVPLHYTSLAGSIISVANLMKGTKKGKGNTKLVDLLKMSSPNFGDFATIWSSVGAAENFCQIRVMYVKLTLKHLIKWLSGGASAGPENCQFAGTFGKAVVNLQKIIRFLENHFEETVMQDVMCKDESALKVRGAKASLAVALALP